MNEVQIQEIVERVLRKLSDADAQRPAPQAEHGSTGEIGDITKTNLTEQYLVERPHDREAFMALKRATPARVGIGSALSRHKTATVLRFQADHAAAQDAVFSDVDEAFLKEMNLATFQTRCQSRDEFLTRPDKGRAFDPATLDEVAAYVGSNVEVLLYLADGLSSTAVMTAAKDILPVIEKGLGGYGIKVSKPFFVKYARVGTMDALAEKIKPDVACVLLGERPGLVTAESMSAYMAYKPTPGMPESRRTVLANIHRGGAPVVEAGAHIVDLIRLMLEKKQSGTELQI